MKPTKDFNDILKEIGPCGWYQIRTNILLWLITGAAGVSLVAYVFTAFGAASRCIVPQCGEGRAIHDFGKVRKTQMHPSFIKILMGQKTQN